jgi:hypothetical protein
MYTYLICYGSISQKQNFSNLARVIEKMFPTLCRCYSSMWIVKSNFSVDFIKDYLQEYINGGDNLMVIECGEEIAWTGFDDNYSRWLFDYF